MRINVLAYTQLDSLLTVELQASEVALDGTDLPLRFMGRSNVSAPASGYGTLADVVFQISQTLAQMALDLVEVSS